ncbi:hypothetical protein QYE76_021508 [Lolium multiflorum]|uniref:Homeobox domain-containing protein n=1 Tax=Lolium multiflorum TaxID=4521 RepID=A0AAD8R813_LOLMU|nr:hypothetical protein QYE76_021508 [Lolium multiflorum]
MIRVFLWQLIRGRLPSGDQLLKRNGPSNGRCALCGEWETCDHIFFTCHIAKFMWAGIRELLACSWDPAGAADFVAIANGLSGRFRRIAWFTFAAQSWALWNIRNKLAIEGSLISISADAIFKMSIYMQSWRVLVRPRDRPLLDMALDEITMEGQWEQEPNDDVNTELVLGIGSPGEYSMMLQDLRVDPDGLLGLVKNTNMGKNGDASTTAIEQDNSNDTTRRADWSGRHHNRDQVHQLEIVFRKNQHPYEKERADLARRLGITRKQVKFWFQNRRTSQKIQGQRMETNELREENESLKAERLALMAAIEDSRCLTCSGRMVQAGETARQQLLLENTRLREEIQKTNAFLQTVSMGTTPRLTATSILFKAFQAAHMRS